MNKLKLLNLKKINLFYFLIYLFPISFILGTGVLNINSFLIAIFAIYYVFNERNFIIKYKSFFKFFFIFFFLIILNCLFSYDIYASSLFGINILKFFFTSVGLLFFFEDKKENIEKFSFFLIFLSLFVCADTFFQYFFGKDIFGYEINYSHGYRLSGPFNNEYVVGSFLSKIVFLSLIKLNSIQKKYYLLFFLIFVDLTILISNERAATIMMLICTFLFFSFSKIYYPREKILIIVLIFSIIFSVFKFNNKIREHFINNTLNQFQISKFEDLRDNKFFDSQWGAHYLTAIEVFKDNPIFGTGLKTFRKVCGDPKYENIDSKSYRNRCSTHPHNFYLEFLSEGGIFLFSYFLIINLLICYNFLKLLFMKKYLGINHSLPIFLLYFILFNPIQTTGAIFSSWNGAFYWLAISFIIYQIRLMSPK